MAAIPAPGTRRPALPGRCPSCHGTGTVKSRGAAIGCPRCRGSGSLKGLKRLPPNPGALLKGHHPDVPR